MITSRSPKRSMARALRCSSQRSAIRSSSSSCSLLRVGSNPWDSARMTSARRSERRSISSLISFSVRMPSTTRRPTGIFLRIPELVEAVLVDPEVVRELVENGDPDLLLELFRVGKRLGERLPEDRDLVGEVLVRFPEPEEVGVVRILVLDDHGDVLQGLREVRRQLIEGPPHVLFEPHALDRRSLPPGGAGLRGRLPRLEPPGLTGPCRALCPPAVGPQERVENVRNLIARGVAAEPGTAAP